MSPLYPSLLRYPTEMLEVVLVAAVVLLAGRWAWLRVALRRVPTEHGYWLAAWCVLGLGLRLLGGVRVPGWINNHGYEYLSTLLIGAIDGLDFHGNGSYALHRLGLIVLPWTETSVLAIQLACSVLTIPAVYAVSRLWLGSRDGALAAAAIVAVLPSFVFYAMTEERLVGGVFFFLVALVAVGIAVREGGAASWAAAGALGSFAASFQPFLLLFPFAAGGLLWTTADGRRALRTRACWGALAVFVVLSIDTIFLALSNIGLHRGPATMVFAMLRVPWQAFLPGASLHGDAAGNTFAGADFTPPPFLWLAFLGTLAAVVRRQRLPLLAVVAIAAVFTLVGAVPARMNTVRLQLPAHACYALLAGHGLGVIMAALRTVVRTAPGIAGAFCTVAVIASIALWSGPIGASFTPQLERRVALDGLGAMPDGCRVEILIPAIPGARGLDYLTPGIPWHPVSGQVFPSDSVCPVYFRPARCYDIQDGAAAPGRTDGLRADCADIEQHLTLTPLFVRSVAARPDYNQRYSGEALEVGYFRVQSPAPTGGAFPVLPSLAAGDQGASDGAPVIPSGQEELLAEMLGRGAELPSGCKFTDGQAQPTRILATYRCPQGEVLFELVHSSRAPADAALTAQFAVTLRAGSPPPDLADALLSRIRIREAAFEWRGLPERSLFETVLIWAVVALPLTALSLGCLLAWRALRGGWWSSTPAAAIEATRPSSVGGVRAVGLAAVLVVSLYGAGTRLDRSDDALATLLGVLPLAAFLWLTVSGFFGYGSARRSDWVGLLPFAVALVVREVFTLHSVQEIEIQFSEKLIGRHSVIYPLFQMFFTPMVRDSHSFIMHLNGVLGALASLALYLFVRQRTTNRGAALLCALFLALHPVVARFAPTDGPYSFVLAAWFSGLALLSAPALDARAMIGGAGLLGIAATARIEGVLFLLASMVMLDPKILLSGARRAPLAAAFSVALIGTLVAVHMYFLLAFHLGNGLPSEPSFDALFDDAVWPASYNDRLFTSLMWVGAAAGLLSRYRLGLLAYAAMLIVLLPVTRSGDWPVALHRMIPTCALQTIVAGIGVYALTGWIGRRRLWTAVLPGTIVAFYILAQHWRDLSVPYVFSEEYTLVRSHLAPGGIVAGDCTLMTFNSNLGGDVDLNDFRHVVPGMKVIDCRSDDCVAELAKGGCVYYIRSAGCYFHSDGIPPACGATGSAGGDLTPCLNEPSASFERSVDLQPISVRTIDIAGTFPDLRSRYPERAEVGLFRVRLKAAQTRAGAPQEN